ncbi:porin [Thalassotalea sp. PLHSN55]|uniref:porin n=1 Tax=Thalassotalea sp. PLHSN55 TaxID=3435888 RepID=UPI003F830A6E
MKKTLIASALVGLFAANTAIANEETTELRKVIAEQQKVLSQLEKRLDETEQKLEATADSVEATTSGGMFANTTIGGYGELHYNNYDNSDAKIDFHRFVLFVNHEFSDSVRFFSELELEHSLAGDGKPGEVELEQAYVEIDINDALTTKVGLFLIPVGIINETHEPPTFYGVERNPVEKNIIPATWWEAGAGFNYQIAAGLALDAAVTSGLEVDESFSIRGGRQKVASAKAEDLAYTGRIKYTAIPGLELAATLQYQEDVAQGAMVETASATLVEAHGIYQVEDFSVRALYARWDIDNQDAIDLGRDEQTGWYIEPSYRVNEKVGVFARYAEYDNNAGNSDDTNVESSSFGLNYYIHENVVLKADYEDLGGAKDSKGFNLGFGYQF